MFSYSKLVVQATIHAFYHNTGSTESLLNYRVQGHSMHFSDTASVWNPIENTL